MCFCRVRSSDSFYPRQLGISTEKKSISQIFLKMVFVVRRWVQKVHVSFPSKVSEMMIDMRQVPFFSSLRISLENVYLLLDLPRRTPNGRSPRTIINKPPKFGAAASSERERESENFYRWSASLSTPRSIHPFLSWLLLMLHYFLSLSLSLSAAAAAILHHPISAQPTMCVCASACSRSPSSSLVLFGGVCSSPVISMGGVHTHTHTHTAAVDRPVTATTTAFLFSPGV